MKKWIAIVALVFVLPLLAYEIVLDGLRGGGATLMLGATMGSSPEALLAMVLALGLRVYTVLLLPSLLVFALVWWVFGSARVSSWGTGWWRRIRSRKPIPPN